MAHYLNYWVLISGHFLDLITKIKKIESFR